MLQFIHPAMLWGALAAAVPVVIHLIHRRRFRRQRWAAMEWLLEAVRQNQRRLQMENLLLLLVRTLAVLLLALAIARPTFSDVPILGAARQKTRLYVVLDNSGSMAARAGTRIAFDDAVSEVSKQVAALGDDDPVTLVVTNDNPEDQDRRTGRPQRIVKDQTDHGAVRRRLGDLRPAPARADLAEALKIAEESMPAPDGTHRKVVVVTDLQAKSFPGGAKGDTADDGLRQTLTRLREKGAATVLIPVGREPANVAITSLGPAENRDVIQGSTAVFQAEVRNYSDRPQRVEIRFAIDGEERGEASQWVSLPARAAGVSDPPAGAAQHWIKFRPEETGVHVLEATIRSDALTLDDTRAFAFEVRPRIRVLAVDPDLHAGEGDRKPETYWVKLSLAPGESSGPFQVTQISENEFHGLRSLDEWDMILLANVERPAPSDDARQRLETWVAKGGALLLSTGDRVVAQRWNDELYRRPTAAVPAADGRPAAPASPGGLLPGRLLAPVVDPKTPRFVALRGASHPLLAKIVDERYSVFFEPPVLHGYTPFEGLEADKAAQVVLTLDDLPRTPVLVAKPFVRGRVLVFGSTLDDAWGRLPGSFVFPALLHEVTYWLTTRGDARRNVFAFQPWSRDVPAATASAELTYPDGTKGPVEIEGAGASMSVRVDDTSRLGVHRVTIAMKPKDLLGAAPPPERDAFSSGMFPEESDLRRLGEDEVLARYRDLIQTGGESEKDAQRAEAQRGEIATALVSAALACLLLEIWLVQRIGRRRRK